jgi:hypothetical protein
MRPKSVGACSKSVPSLLQNGQCAMNFVPQLGQIRQSALAGVEGSVSAIVTASQGCLNDGIIAKRRRRRLRKPTCPERAVTAYLYSDAEKLSVRPRSTGGRFILPTEYKLLQLLLQPLAKVNVRHQTYSDWDVPRFLGHCPCWGFGLRLCVHFTASPFYLRGTRAVAKGSEAFFVPIATTDDAFWRYVARRNRGPPRVIRPAAIHIGRKRQSVFRRRCATCRNCPNRPVSELA